MAEENRHEGRAFVPPPEAWSSGGRVLTLPGVDEVCDLAISGEGGGAGQKSVPGRAAKVIDARGLLVTPGIVDIHTHLYSTGGNPEAWAGSTAFSPTGSVQKRRHHHGGRRERGTAEF